MYKTYDVTCDLCQGDDADFLFNAKDLLYGYEGFFSYVRCKSCGLIYMNPRVSDEDISGFYPDDYVPHRSKEKASKKSNKTFAMWWKNTTIAIRLKRLRKKLLGTEQAISFVDKKLNSESRVMDVGCGRAEFLYNIKQQTGCHVEGVDISKTAVDTAARNYDIEIFNGLITEAPFPAESFDVITAWWYLEHVSNPSEVLKKMCSFLKDDGLCIVGVPNIDSFNAKVFKDKWYHLDCPRHLHIYSPDTIKSLMDNAGFVVTKIVYHKTAWGLLPSLRYCFGNNNIPLKQRKRLKCASSLKRLLLPWTMMVSLFKKSDIIVVYARRK